MIKIIKNIEQGSAEWFLLRCGSIGASDLSKILTSKGARSSQRTLYLYQLAAEILTGEKTETYSNQYMKDGNTNENTTLSMFSFTTGLEIERVALILPDNAKGYHCSPDSIVKGKKEGVEVKSVIPSTQVKYLDKNKLPTEYKLQCQFSLFVTGWDLWHFFSYCPLLDPLYIKVPRDTDLIEKIKTEIDLFLTDLNSLVKRIR